jgi:hypothetical protein
MSDIETTLGIGGFEIKEWTMSGSAAEQVRVNSGNVPTHHDQTRVLGVIWDPSHEEFKFEVQVKFELKSKTRAASEFAIGDLDDKFPSVLSRRIILSRINGLYDALGLLQPFVIRMKIEMAKLWKSADGVSTIGWDEPIPAIHQRIWSELFSGKCCSCVVSHSLGASDQWTVLVNLG